MIDDKILTKIQNLIELANDGNDEEGQTALLMAQRLMLKHDISLDQVEAFGNNKGAEEESSEKVVDSRKRMPWWIKTLHAVLAANFRCRSLVNQGSGITHVSFFGAKGDVEVVSKIYEAAVMYLNYRLKRLPNKSPDYKNSYLQGFLSALAQRFQAQVEEFGLMVIPSEKVNDDFAAKYPLVKTSRLKRPEGYNEDAYISGKRDGESATILPDQILGEED